MSEKESGVVKWFDEKKGYGFIARQAGGDVFVHYSDITGQGFRTLKEGDNVEFVVKQNQKGQAATEVIKV
jgi:CspA family cold shock protein